MTIDCQTEYSKFFCLCSCLPNDLRLLTEKSVTRMHGLVAFVIYEKKESSLFTLLFKVCELARITNSFENLNG